MYIYICIPITGGNQYTSSSSVSIHARSLLNKPSLSSVTKSGPNCVNGGGVRGGGERGRRGGLIEDRRENWPGPLLRIRAAADRCMCMCMCVEIGLGSPKNMCVIVHVHVHGCVCARIGACTCACVCVCAGRQIGACTCACVWARARVRVCVYVRPCALDCLIWFGC